MDSRIVDAIVSGSSPTEISQEIKDILYSKATERVETYRSVVADRIFDGETTEEEVGSEEGGEE